MSLQVFLNYVLLVTFLRSVMPITGNEIVNYCVDNPTLGTNYIKQLLVILQYSIYSLAVSHHTKNIYAGDWEGDLFVLKHIEKAKDQIQMNCKVLGLAVDGLLPTLYVGCETGLKTYHEYTGVIETNKRARYAFWQLYVPNFTSHLYAVRYDNHEVYHYRNLSSDPVKLNFQVKEDLRYQLVLNSQGNLIYTAKENTKHVAKILLKSRSSPLSYQAFEFLNFAADSKGRVYGTGRKGVYRLNPDSNNALLLTALDFSPLHMCFDFEDNLIFGSYSREIIRFRYDDACFY